MRVVVCRPGLAATHHLQARLRSLPADPPRLLAVGESPYSPEELAAACGIGLLGAIAFDARAADTLGDGPALSERALNRSALVRSARSVATGLAAAAPDAPLVSPTVEP